MRRILFLLLLVLFSFCLHAQNSNLCTGSLGDPIINITFGSGNNPGSQLSAIVPGASTTYGFTPVTGNPAMPIPLDGNYTITNNVPANSNWFQGAADHTGNTSGYMAFFNANPTPGEFYKQTVSNLCPGTSYQFSAWIANVLNPNATVGVQPDVTFRIEKTDGTLVASYKTGGIAQSFSMTWNEYGFFFTTPSDGSTLVLKMINTNVGGTALPGNDFAIDDITFRACTAQLTASFNANTLQNSIKVCPNTGFTLYGDANPFTTNYDYLWQSSSDNGITWTDLPNSNKISLSLISPSQAGFTTLYRMLSSQKGNITSKNCRGASNNVTLTTSTLCTKDKIPCSNWYYNTTETGAFRGGDLDVTGHTITVEANINRTVPYYRPDNDTTLDGDVVSKHRDQSDVNYLLRSNRCEITTTNGHFRTPPVCRIELDKTYHVAMTYDGQTLKFYRNGYLMSSVPASGELITNNYQLTIGNLAYQPGYDYTSFKGYINNVRIWNVVRTQSQVNTYMDSTLTNPASQNGLLAYYTFDNLSNKQGNIAWDGFVENGATINQSNPTCGSFIADSCTSCKSNWLFNPSDPSYVDIGNLNVPGNQLTVEALIDRTQPYSDGVGDNSDGDIVSKHLDPSNTNYLLRPNHAYITTSNGFFGTPDVCKIELNKTYHVAMVYDGATLKFYRNGFLLSQTPATGNLSQNDLNTLIGRYQGSFTENFIGYTNEVRIWNVARTQSQLQTYLNQSLPNPASQPGLLAYYIFDDIKNKQGDTRWDGILTGSASINQPSPICGAFVADSCGLSPIINPPVVAAFSAPDTVCVNAPFAVSNTTTGATTNYWNFCSPDLLNKPTDTSLGNPGLKLNVPVYTDYILVNGNYYMFVVNNNNYGGLTRLDFGSSLLNAPTAVSLTNLLYGVNGGTAEGIQFEKVNGKWIAVIVGGDSKNNYTSFIAKLDFGTDITNTNPVITDWGNVGNLSYPHELYVFKEGSNWYGYTTSTYSSELIRYNFGADFTNTPVATNLGTLNGNLNYPVGLYDYIKNGNHYLFVTNVGNNNGTSLTRLDFGSSLLSTPKVNNLGNLGGKFGASYDFTITENCNQIIGMAFDGNNGLDRYSFPNANITKTPVFTDTVQTNNFNFPHSFSKIYREGSDSYFFIPNAASSTFSRIKISGCASASKPGTNTANPGSISYNAPGTYTISLTINEGLPTQAVICKNVLAISQPKQAPPKDTSFCEGSSIRLTSSFSNGTYLWNTGSTDSSIRITQPGKYWVQINNGIGCGVTDSFNVATKTNPVVNLGADTGLCKNQSLLLNAGNNGSNYVWQDGSTKPTYNATKGGTYYVTVTNTNKCSKTDTIKIADYASPIVNGLNDVKICSGNSAQLSVTANGSSNTYSWLPSSGLNNSAIANPTAKSLDTTNYIVTVTNINGCSTKDTNTVFVLPPPVVKSISDTGFCIGNSIVLQTTTSNSTGYSWSPSTGLDNTSSLSPKATPNMTTPYIVTAKNDGCNVSDTVKLTVYALPAIAASNDTTVCGATSVQLSASGGSQYQWSPSTGLSNASIANPVASVNTTALYIVIGTDKNGCVNKDSVRISNLSLTQFTANASTPFVCAGDSVLLTASGGSNYSWQPSQGILHPADSSTYAVPTSSTTYTVQITNQQCKTTGTKDVNVLVNPLPQIKITKSNDIDCRNKEAILTASGGTSYIWSPAVTDSVNDISTIKVMPEETTVYKLTATSDKGCISTDTITVKVNINLENQYPLANAFSPNGDGINDCFGIKSWSALKVDFQIYDRWGWLLFHSTDPQNVCWDGRYNGKNQLDGTYVYKIYAVTACGIINKTGAVVLIRAAR